MIPNMRKSRRKPIRKANPNSSQRRQSKHNNQLMRKDPVRLLRFEKLITEISTRLTNLATMDYGREIKFALRHLMKFFEVDRCALFFVSDGGKEIFVPYVVSKPGLKSLPKRILTNTSLPWTFHRIIRLKKAVCVTSMQEMPAKAGTDYKTYRSWGVRSILWIPLVIEHQVKFIIKISSHTREINWPKEYMPHLRLLGELIANAVISKQTELALKENEQRFRKFFEEVPEYCYIVSPAGIILDLSTAALRMLKYEKEEIVGKPLSTIYAPESIIKMKKLFNRWQRTGRISNEEMTIIDKNGDRRKVLLSANAVRDVKGKIINSVSVQTDITENVKVMRELAEKSQELAAKNEELTKLNKYLNAVREKERTRIAQALHDELGQTLTALMMDTRWIAKHMEADNTGVLAERKR